MPRPKIPRLNDKDRKQLEKQHPQLSEYDSKQRSRVNVYLMFQYVDPVMSDRRMSLFIEQREDNHLAPLLRQCRDDDDNGWK